MQKRRMLRRGALLLVLIAAAGGLACAKKPPRIPVRAVVISGMIAADTDAAGPSRQYWRELATTELSADNRFAWNEAADDGFVLKLVVLEAIQRSGNGAGAGGAASRVALELKLNRHLPDGNLESYGAAGLVSETRPATGASQALPFAELARQAVGKALDGLARNVNAGAESAAQLVATLSAQDAEERLRAAEVLGERREAAAVPGLLKTLRDRDPRVRERALGALEQIGDARAVLPIADYTAFSNTAEALRAIAIIARLGGEDARQVLTVLATGHEEKMVRHAAARGLEKLQSPPVPPAAAAWGGASPARKPAAE